jgi:hypothetical protein
MEYLKPHLVKLEQAVDGYPFVGKRFEELEQKTGVKKVYLAAGNDSPVRRLRNLQQLKRQRLGG